ncbi:1,4-dihydroxy-2-naphthoyl-CoA synthase [Parageobacillus thermoglucosidasius]|nr:1,4-dihydroxy-2-naphthoyl-CoA synthase [Parageobacillus thermoglucosidasius]GAJ44871.1 naphthoate synthase [Parageobacillus thermoglucosidasius NBRC 107763]
MEFGDILFEKESGIATITINRPKVLNAFRRQTLEEMIKAFEDAGQDPEIGVILLTGAGDRAFCVGGDVKEWGPSGYDSSSWIDIGLPVVRLHEVIRSVPKPVIAVVNGYAIGGGHVLQVVCDLAIASQNAVFGQAGPRVGSFDAGFGTAYLARLVGERKAREIWMLCRQYSADEALNMGLINKVVEPSGLMEEARKWANEILRLSPSALKMIKASFNADTDHIHGLTQLAFGALNFFYGTPESIEGHRAFIEKRTPNFSEFRVRGESS